MLPAIWYTLYDLKNVKNALGGVLRLVQSQVEACILLSNTPPWVFSTFFVSCTNGTK